MLQKIARTGVPFYLSHTIVKAEGKDHVTGVTIAEVDNHFQFIQEQKSISTWIPFAWQLVFPQCHNC